jgi:hypothetical protein
MEKLRRGLDKLLNRYGYYRSDMPDGSEVTEAEILEMFKAYGTNEMFLRLLRDMCARDIKLYFQASNDDERRTIRGAHARTNYFISLIRKANGKGNRKD